MIIFSGEWDGDSFYCDTMGWTGCGKVKTLRQTSFFFCIGFLQALSSREMQESHGTLVADSFWMLVIKSFKCTKRPFLLYLIWQHSPICSHSLTEKAFPDVQIASIRNQAQWTNFWEPGWYDKPCLQIIQSKSYKLKIR